MKKLRALIITLILFLMTVSHGYSMEFKSIVMFGDSLSDNGNFFAVHGSYPPAPYYEGRFSDGPVWIEYLAEELGFTGKVLNYAHGGAMTGDSNVSDDSENSKEFPGFLDEVEAYLSVAATSINYPGAFAMPEDTLFTIWIGANDLWEVTDTADAMAKINQAASNVEDALSQLIAAGASKFIIITLPDLGKTPKFNKDATASAQATQLASLYNQVVEQVVSGIETAYPDITIELINASSILSDYVDNAETLGFTNTTDAKLNLSDLTVAEGTYMFWDGVHPTTFTHKLIAKDIAESIDCENCTGNMMPYFESDLTLKVPSAKLGDNSYGFTLVPYNNTAESGIFWSLDMESIEIK